MKAPWSAARGFALFGSALVLGASAIGCGSSTPTPALNLPAAVTKALEDPNFQAEGPLTGALAFDAHGTTIKAQITGTFQFSGADSSVFMTTTAAGVSGTSDSVTAGDWLYTRTNGGPWARSPRSSAGAGGSPAAIASAAASASPVKSAGAAVSAAPGKSAASSSGATASPGATASSSADATSLSTFDTGSLAGFIAETGGLEDYGAEDHFDRKLHHLSPKDLSKVTQQIFGLDASKGYTEVKPGYIFWADTDGTLAGLTESATAKQVQNGTTVNITLTVDFSFDKLTDVVVAAPEGAAVPDTKLYSQAVALRKNLAALTVASGKIQGTLTAGPDTMPLSGTFAMAGGASQIKIVEGKADQSPQYVEEIVKGGIRYTSRDDIVWVNRGKKPAAATFPAVLRGATTDQDAGIATIQDRQLHRIVSPANSADMALALGLDLNKVSGPDSRLRIWADDTGHPVGFGATIQWGRIIDGQPKAYVMEFDVIFAAGAAAPIAAPRSPWRFISDDANAVAFALPAGWAAQKTPLTGAVASYTDAKHMGVFAYSISSKGIDTQGMTPQQMIDTLGLTFPVESKFATTVDGNSGASFLGGTGTAFMIGTLVIRGQKAYLFMFVGPNAQKVDRERINDAILASIEFAG
jgi:hypothetical protein